MARNGRQQPYCTNPTIAREIREYPPGRAAGLSDRAGPALSGPLGSAHLDPRTALWRGTGPVWKIYALGFQMWESLYPTWEHLATSHCPHVSFLLLVPPPNAQPTKSATRFANGPAAGISSNRPQISLKSLISGWVKRFIGIVASVFWRFLADFPVLAEFVRSHPPAP